MPPFRNAAQNTAAVVVFNDLRLHDVNKEETLDLGAGVKTLIATKRREKTQKAKS
jgi:hypothetical protein